MAISPERLRQIEELYHSARELLSDQRDGFLNDACGNDAELLRTVLALLAQDVTSGPMERPILGVAARLLADPPDAGWAPGSRVGPYQIVSRLGEGGMGEVFKARDTRLGRQVAIKTAYEEFSDRFLREARAISALNHPNICTLYDIGPDYLVMELVEGANLAGPVPIDTAIGYARQIAAGLEAAHERNVIHRDLKPANIKVTPDGTVKILDFGLAKSAEAPAGGQTVTMTGKGMILGTAAYMAPEQARGETVDKRADIWAFGVILYELLTGKVLFGGSKSVSEVLAAVLTSEPDFKALPGETPPRVRRLLERCLRKDSRQRLRDIGEARVLLDEPESEAPAHPAPRRRWPAASALATLAVLAAFGLYRWLSSRATEPFQHIQITKLTDTGKAIAAAISPDGKYVAHVLTDEGKSSLWLFHVATGSNVQIVPPSSEWIHNLSFSPDGNSLYYLSGYYLSGAGQALKLCTVPVLGGNVRTLVAFDGRTIGGPGTIVVASLSPDEKRLAFIRHDTSRTGLFVANLDGSNERQLVGREQPDHLYPTVAWSPDGKTLGFGDGTYRSGDSSGVSAVAVEGGSGKRIGAPPWYNIHGLLWLPDANGFLAVANQQFPLFQIWHVSYPGGQTRRLTNDLSSYDGLSLTRDGSALVTVQQDINLHLSVAESNAPESAREISTGHWDGMNGVAWAGQREIYFEAPGGGDMNTQIWITSADGTRRRQITSGQLTGGPRMCGDGRHLVYFSFNGGTPHIWQADPDGGNARQLTNGAGEYRPDCSPDGLWLTYWADNPKSIGTWKLPIDGGTPVKISDHPGNSWISPDGKFVLILGEKVRIVPATGGQPIRSFDRSEFGEVGDDWVRWSADGTALLYIKTVAGVSNIWRRPLDRGEPTPLTAFAGEVIGFFDISRDGKLLALSRGSVRNDVVLIRDLK